MSCLLMPNGDDHPEAAHKHLLDAGVLLAQRRPDGAGYLSGYVVECALKSLYVFETGQPLRGHDFVSLTRVVSAVATMAGARIALRSSMDTLARSTRRAPEMAARDISRLNVRLAIIGC